jgi:hypothetical protein
VQSDRTEHTGYERVNDINKGEVVMGLTDLTFAAINVNSGLEAYKPVNPKPGDIYATTDTKKLFVCYNVGVWVDITSSIRNIYSGLEASKQINPKQGDIYASTDTKKLFVCYSAGIWTDITRKIENINSGLETYRPSNPRAGDIYASTNTKKLFLCYYPGIWTDITSNIRNIYSGLEAARPASPKPGDIYASTDTKKLFVCYSLGEWVDITREMQTVNSGVKILKQDSNIEGGEFVLEGPNATYPNVTIDHYKGMVRLWQPGTAAGLRVFSVPTLGANAFDGYLCPVLQDNVAPTIITQEYWSDKDPGSHNTPTITGPAYIQGGIAMKQTEYNYSFCRRMVNGVAQELTFVKGAAGQDLGADGKIGYAFIAPFYLRPGEVTYWSVGSTYTGLGSTVEHGASVQIAYIQL